MYLTMRLLTASAAFGLALAAGPAAVQAADMWDKQRDAVETLSRGESLAWDNIKEQLFSGKEIAKGDGVIALEAPPRVTDAAFIPITISSLKPQTPDDYIKTIYLIIDENPSPVAAVFHLEPENTVANISTRVRIDSFTAVRAIAEDNQGKVYMADTFLRAAGGCSAPSLSDSADARTRLGKMKLNFIKAASGGELGEAQILVSHPNYTGFQFDQVARREIPAEFINSVEVTYGDTKVLSAETGNSISENPSFFFNYKDTGADEMKAVITDTEGRVFERSFPVERATDGKS